MFLIEHFEEIFLTYNMYTNYILWKFKYIAYNNVHDMGIKYEITNFNTLANK